MFKRRIRLLFVLPLLVLASFVLAEQQEDRAHVSGDVGDLVLAVRRDAASTLAGTDGDYAPLQLDSSGGLRVQGPDVLPAVTLLASAARTTSATEADATDASLENAQALILVLNVTAQSGTSPTLDLAVQAKVDGSYTNLARFSQYGAATGKKGLNLKRALAFTTELTLEAAPAVGTGVLVNNHDWTDTLRVRHTIAGTTPSYTFSVTAYPIK